MANLKSVAVIIIISKNMYAKLGEPLTQLQVAIFYVSMLRAKHFLQKIRPYSGLIISSD
jgi:hypothetical protein